jgi:hypothetical protein
MIICSLTDIQILSQVGFEVLTTVVMKSPAFCDIRPSTDISEKHVASIFRDEASLLPASYRFLAWFIFDPEDGGDMLLRNIG